VIVVQFAWDTDTCKQLTTQVEAFPNDGYVVVVGVTEEADVVEVPFVLAVSVPDKVLIPDKVLVPECVPEVDRVWLAGTALDTVTEPVGAVCVRGRVVWAAEKPTKAKRTTATKRIVGMSVVDVLKWKNWMMLVQGVVTRYNIYCYERY